MIGLAILGAATLYCVAWGIVFKMVPGAGAKAIVALVAVGIPSWDIPIGYVHFRELCRTSDGLRISGELPQRGIALVVKQPFSHFSVLRARLEFDFFDVIDVDGRLERWRVQDSKVSRVAVPTVATIHEAPVLLTSGYGESLGWHTRSLDLLIVTDRARERQVAKVSEVTWRWGWIRDGVLGDLPGGVELCDESKASSEAVALLKRL